MFHIMSYSITLLISFPESWHDSGDLISSVRRYEIWNMIRGSLLEVWYTNTIVIRDMEHDSGNLIRPYDTRFGGGFYCSFSFLSHTLTWWILVYPYQLTWWVLAKHHLQDLKKKEESCCLCRVWKKEKHTISWSLLQRVPGSFRRLCKETNVSQTLTASGSSIISYFPENQTCCLVVYCGS